MPVLGQNESSINDLILRVDSALVEDDAEMTALRELTDLTLSQLHQAQQELQYYSELCESQAEMLSRALALLVKALN